MRQKIYNTLVNRHRGIAERYHLMHDNSSGGKKLLSWLYLLWLNFCYYVLFCRFLDKPKCDTEFENKGLLIDISESQARLNEGLSVEETIERLSKYDVVSFDIFDTLILRPFDEPTALFYLMGERLGYMDFKRIRTQLEAEARWEKYKKEKTYEVNLVDIWNRIEKVTGLSAQKGIELEEELEAKYCYANPFMKKVFDELVAMKKTIIITSDMYLSEEFLTKLLESKGYCGAKKLYVSNRYNKSKANGELYTHVLEDMGISNNQMIHIGDNENSDIRMAKQKGIDTCYFPNMHKKIVMYRAYDMAPIVGAAYRGIVDNYIYGGLNSYSMEYEYGYIYGGFFIVGYCHFVHEYCRLNNIDKVLFLSRDGDILNQVYKRMYPDSNTEYVYWSRKAATKLMASSDRYDYFRRFLEHKVNQQISLKKIFESMEISSLLQGLISSNTELKESTNLTDKNVITIKEYLTDNWNKVLACYEEEHAAAKKYYSKVLTGCSKCVAVDVGWAGSGAMALRQLIKNVWDIPCDLVGIIAGTNSLHNYEPFASETFLLNGQLVSYLYSMAHNRDLVKLHDPNKDYNVYWELLLSSPTKQFIGFDWEDEAKNTVKLRFGKFDDNLDGIREIQKGILDFAEQYIEHFGELDYMFNISGRDAYAPMLVAASYNEKYLKAINKKFDLDISIG